MGSGSSTRLAETAKANSISQEFHNSNNNKSKQRYQRFSYCSIASDTNHQLANQPSIYDNHIKQTNFNNNNNNNITNKYYKFPDVASSNVNTILLPNRFKSFENFIVPNQLQQQHQQQTLISSKQSTPDTFESTSNSSNSSNSKLTKSLIMYDVDFEKFNRCANDSSTHRLDKLKSSHSHNRSFKTMNSVTSSIYQDLIELDKDLAKRENDLKQQQQQQYSSSRVSTSSSAESSSGCSSGASSSNLSVSRRKSMSTLRKNDSSLYSINVTSQSGTFKTGTSSHPLTNNNNVTSTSRRDNMPSESQSNLSSKTSPLLTSASSTSTTSSCSNKSILSTSANLSSSCSSISSPTQYFSPKSYSKATQNHDHRHKKRAQNRRSLLNKTKSECLFNNLNTTQSSSSSSSSSTKDDDKDSIYVRQFPTVTEHLNQTSLVTSVSEENSKKSNKSKLNKANRDSGIIVDLFHLNGSMTNLKTKLNNAKMNLRNSFSVFNLKHSATSSSLNGASKKPNKKKDLINSSSCTSASIINSITNSSTNNLSATTQHQQQVLISNAAAVSSPMLSNSRKEINNFQEFNNQNATVFSSSTTTSSTASPDDENINNNNNEVIKHQNSRENFFSNNNNNNNIRTASTTKSKLNTISSSINNFLSNLTTTSTNNTNNNLNNIIKNSNIDNNENFFTNSTNLVLNKNKNSNIINDTLVSTTTTTTNNNNKQTNYKAATESNCANTLSQSTTSLNASNSGSCNTSNNESNYKLTRFSNSIKINDNKQQKQQFQQQPIIKRTMTFHSTNNSTTKQQNETISATTTTTAAQSNEINSSFKPNVSSSSVLANLNPTSICNSTSTNIKLVNSKTISSFKTKTDNSIPVITIEKRNKQLEKPAPQQQIKHSVSMGATLDESHQLQQQQAAKTNALASHRHQKIVVQASTSDLLNCFSVYISEKCPHLLKETYINPLTYMNNEIGKRIKFEPRDTINWLRSADRALLIQGWQEIAFMNPVNVVFVYLLVKETLNDVDVKTVYELQCYIMACLYLAFSYMGNEISYPLKPFLIEENRDVFWQRVCDLMSKLSSCMLRINRDPRFFTELFYELKSYSITKKPEPIKLPTSTSVTSSITPIPSNLMSNSCYKQLTDQINSIEIKIDSFSRNINSQSKQTSSNGEDDNSKVKIKASHDKALVSSISINGTQNNKSLIQLNDSTRTRSVLNNENQNPFNSYCI